MLVKEHKDQDDCESFLGLHLLQMKPAFQYAASLVLSTKRELADRLQKRIANSRRSKTSKVEPTKQLRQIDVNNISMITRSK